MTESYSGEVLDWDLSSDGAVLAVVRDTDAKATRTVLDVWRTTDHQRIASVPMPTYLSEEGPTPDLPLVMQMSGDGSSIVMAMESGGVRTWTGGTTLTVLPIAAGAADDTASPQLVMPNAGPAIFAYAPSGKAITIHDRATGSVVARIPDAGTVAMMLFSPDGGELFVGYDTGGGAIYDATNGNILARLNGRHDNGIIDAMFSGDGRSLLTASIDSTTRVWDVDTGMMINTFASAQGVPYAEISHNGDRIITGSDGRTSTLWDVETGKVLTTLPGPLKSGNSFGWFNDKTGGAATTLSENSTLRRWNIATPRVDRDALITEACKDGGRFSVRERALNLITETEVLMCNDQRRR
jgi:WD40 repeat protein